MCKSFNPCKTRVFAHLLRYRIKQSKDQLWQMRNLNFPNPFYIPKSFMVDIFRVGKMELSLVPLPFLFNFYENLQLFKSYQSLFKFAFICIPILISNFIKSVLYSLLSIILFFYVHHLVYLFPPYFKNTWA